MTFFRTVLGYKIQYTLLSFLCIGATVLVSWQHFVPANQTNFYTYSCSINNAGQGRTLKIRNVISNLSTTFADKLCASKTLSQHGYSHVQIEWPTSKQLTARVLVDGQYDFILNRHHHLKGLVLDIDELYQPISIFSGYDIFWWNKFESPQLTAAFLANKTIGVTSNTKSHPYYLIPLRSLSDAGIQLSEQQIKVFPSSDSLFRRLFKR
ncbi:hypothetical protein RS130_19930 [Paraglaciecola aquimarina]|uniref:Solute-binding protein family 3/N-terminal domain-containing protein n=1 Tax=Paraglaciecola aquimarina TaxID=1235557 RepID=A0ABU3T0Q2_9ALTE|nr:hypothetical protein [Paraglaciecola aquimarina]MDU0355852.1 hypothetical protein [Paraglaciecola aquimarina]